MPPGIRPTSPPRPTAARGPTHILPAFPTRSSRLSPAVPDAVQQPLPRRYAELFDIFVKYRASIGRITFWGVTDGGSWLNNFPIRGRTNYPLLFDREGKPKAAFFSVIGTASGAK